MRRTHHRCLVPARAVLATAVMVIAASACGGSAGDRGSARPTAPASARVDHRTLIRALEATRSVESGRVVVTTTLTDVGAEPDRPPGGRLAVAKYRVAFDRRVARVEVEFELSGAAGAPGARDDAVGGDVSLVARMIAAGDAVYAQGGLLAAATGRAPGEWVEIDRGAFVARRPSSDAAILLLDPLGPFEVVGDTTGDARVVGRAVLRGSPVTQLATSAGSADSAVDAAPVDVWIDADGVIRRMEIRLAGGVEAGASRVVTTVELFDIGRAMAITSPGGER